MLFAAAVRWAARVAPPVEVAAPMCVQATAFIQKTAAGSRTVVQLFNGVNTTANHGLPASDVPLREETIPFHGITLAVRGPAPGAVRCEPGSRPVTVTRVGDATRIELPPLDLHFMAVIA